jgi:hypothetical protein
MCGKKDCESHILTAAPHFMMNPKFLYSRTADAGNMQRRGRTPETLQEMAKLTDENLLSLEVLWAPEAQGTPLTKEEVMASLEAPRTSGYASVQTLDLYGMNMS